MIKMSNTQSEIYIGNNIEYDMNSYQVKKAIVKFTKVRIKGLKLKHLQKETLV